MCFSINFLPDGRLPPRIAVCTLTPRMEGRMKSAFAASMLCSIALSFVACTDEGLPTELARNGGNYTGTFSIIAGTFPETGRISIHFLTDSRYSYTAIRPVVPPANDSLLAEKIFCHVHKLFLFLIFICYFDRRGTGAGQG